jgi:NAD(P)-dependent dehydrogenase (short-subunit alcohol dehydrogenase family)/acyl carrier protein
MALEADLGIDSIKRVEIFAAVQDALPGLPELPHSDIGRLRTLEDIAVYLEGHLGTQTAAQPVPAPAAPSHNVRATLWALVADKTGYPSEMLEPGMALEADLGIDSIKRVEIFAAVQDALPGLPELPHSDIGRLRTLEDIAVYLEGHLGSHPAPAPAAPPSAAAPAHNVRQTLWTLVSDKTGYPSEMLEPGMALEADLGIDSIKRVEIFAAVQDALPGLPELPHSDIGRLRTLEDIAVYLEGHLGGAPAPAPPAAAPVPTVDLQTALIEVIADKTGYPVEMLNPDMALEADLGIDSIKRVEIFAALIERVPGMKEPDMAELGPLKSIADVAGYLQGNPIAAAPVSAPVAAPAAKPAPTGLRQNVHTAPAAPTSPALAGHSLLDESSGSITITDDGRGIGDALAELLIARGFEAAVSDEVPAGIRAAICLSGLRQFESREQAIAANLEAFKTASAVAAAISAEGGVFVTVQDTGGRFAPSDQTRAWAGGLSALAKTASLEWPRARVKAIDIEIAGRTPHFIAQALLDELLSGGPEKEVGLTAGGERFTVETSSGPASGSELTLGPDSVIVASGGARGVTAQSLVRLAQTTHSRFVLLGRTAADDEPAFCHGLSSEAELRQAFLADAKSRDESISPAALSKRSAQVIASREVAEVLKAFKDASAEARYIALDIRDAEAVAKALDEVRAAWGPISGLVHGAGVLADKLIKELTPEGFNKVFSTKVEGLEALLDATAKDPLKFICLFSSVAARNGNPGQAAYAMANETMNRVAYALAANRKIRVKSLNWGPWDGGMVTPALRRHFAQNGVELLGIDEGTDLFVDEILHGADGEIEIVLGHPLTAESV